MQNIAKLQHSAPLKLFYMYNVQCTYIVHSHVIGRGRKVNTRLLFKVIKAAAHFSGG